MNKKTANVLFIIDSLTIGGAEKQVVSIVNNLDLPNVRFSLAYLKNDTSLLAHVEQKRLANGLFCCNVRNKLDLTAVSKLSRHIRQLDVDIIICANTYPLFYGWLTKLFSWKRTKIVDVLHSTELRTKKEKVQMQIYRLFYLFTDVLVYVCNNQRDFWEKKLLTAKKSTVIYNGVDADYFYDGWSSHDKEGFRHQFDFNRNDYVVGICAAMRPEKAHVDLLAAISLLNKAGFPVKCLLIGDGPERSNIERTIKDYDISHLCKITGSLTDVRLAVSSCDVMALVSHQIETFSIAALESMSLAKPIVMSNIGGASEQIEHGVNGFLFNAGDIGALTEHLKTLADKDYRLEVGRRNREKVIHKFSLHHMISGYEQLITELACGQ